jgi:uncharacterized membrane-anchored protein YhcB (DUF1043 family)
MKKESIIYLVSGLIVGALIMLFLQFNAKLTTQKARLDQLEQANSVNTQTVNQVVSFLNGSAQQTASSTPNQ